MLCSATNVAAATCHVLSPVFSQLGYGTGTAPARASRCTVRDSSHTISRRDARAVARTHPPTGYDRARSLPPGSQRIVNGGFQQVTCVLPTR